MTVHNGYRWVINSHKQDNNSFIAKRTFKSSFDFKPLDIIDSIHKFCIDEEKSRDTN